MTPKMKIKIAHILLLNIYWASGTGDNGPVKKDGYGLVPVMELTNLVGDKTGKKPDMGAY